MIQHKF